MQIINQNFRLLTAGRLAARCLFTIGFGYLAYVVPVAEAQVAGSPTTSMSVSYAGRLTSQTGAPMRGPVNITATFWDAEVLGTQRGDPETFTDVSLTEGVFSISFAFSGPEAQVIFGDGTATVFIEIIAEGKTYPRQRFNYVPLALRVPVDGTSLSFSNTSGKLGVKGSDGASAGSVLTSDGSGGVAWVAATQAASGTVSLTNTGVTAGSYSRANFVVDQQGRLTSATNSPAIIDMDIAATAAISQSKIAGLTAALTAKQDAISTGTNADYLRGDKTWQTLTTATVPESGTAQYFSIARTRSSLTGIAPLSYSTITGNISLSQASGSANGYVSSSDWTTFNAKQNALGYTPVNRAGDTMSGTLNMGSQTVTGLAAPSAASDAATKSYVDTNASAFLKKDGSISLSAPWSVGNDLTQVGNLTLAQAKTLGLGVFGNDAETLLVASFSNGVNSPDKGKTWFNKDSNQIKYWDGSAAKTLGISGAGLTSLNGLTGGTQTFATGSAGSGPAIVSNGSVHTLNLPLASAGASVTAGLISNTDYANFSSKTSSVSGTAPISVTGTTTPVVSIAQATNTTSGFLSDTDWTTFNAKQAAGNYVTSLYGDVTSTGFASGSVTTTLASVALAGTSTKVTYDVKGRVTSGTTLSASDIPTLTATQITTSLGYTPINRAGDSLSGGLNVGSFDITNAGNIQMTASKTLGLSTNTTDPTGLSAADKGKTWYNATTNQIKYWDGSTAVALGVSGSGLSSLNGQTGNTQTLAAPGSSGTAPAWSSSANIHTLNIPMASTASVTAGLISNADYTAFSNKVNNVVQGPGITVSNASGTATISLSSHSAALITSGTLGVANGGTGATTLAANNVLLGNGTSAPLTVAPGSNGNVLTSNGTTWVSAAPSGGSWTTSGSDVYRSSGNVGIGTTNPGAALDITGQIKIQGGTPAAGKVLISDANGLASWGNAATGTITGVTAGTGLSGGGTSGTVSVSADVGTTANKIVQLDANAKLPAVDGSALTNLNPSNLSGATSVSNGGTGLTSGTSGGIPYFNTTTSMTSSGVLTANGVVLGGGAGVAPTTTSAGAANSVLRIPSAGGTPGFGALDLSQSASVSGSLNVGNGGTGTSLLLTGGAGQYLKQTASGAVITVGTIAASDLPTMVGDSGSGGTKGAVPPPVSGDSAAGKFLKADGSWSVPGSTANWATPGTIGSTTPNTGAFTTLTTSGNTGIGTSTPSKRLHVYNDITNGATEGNVYSLAILRTTSNAANYAAGSESIAIPVINSGVSNYGEVYGTIIRGWRNDAADTGNLTALYGAWLGYGHQGSTSRTTSSAFGLNIQPYAQGGTITNSYGIMIRSPVSGGTITNDFGIYQTSTTSKNFFGGNVGIGTTAPQYKLDVAGSVRLGSTSGATTVEIGDIDTAEWRLGTGGYGLSFSNDFDNNGTYDTRVYMAKDGNVGIGTVTPVATLDVGGTMRMAKNASAPYSCDNAHDGALAITSSYTQCICKGASSSWVRVTDGSSTCYWNSIPIVINGTSRNWSDGTYAISCNAYRSGSGLYTYTGDTGDGIYTIDPDGSGGSAAFTVYCDMTTEGGGWTAVITNSDASRFYADAALWYDTTYDAGPITPSSRGKSQSFATVVGSSMMFKTNNESAGYYAIYNLPTNGSIRDLIGSTNIAASSDGYRATVTYVKKGGNALACWGQNWRVVWRNYGSGDNLADSAVFAPADTTASTRSCGGALSYSTGIGVRTDSGDGFIGYGGSMEGYGSENSGFTGLTGGYWAIYVK